MAYVPFTNVYGGENGTVKGMIPLDGDDAEAFRYLKEIEVRVSIGGGDEDNAQLPITNTWKVRIRENASVDENEKYNGPILFEQTIVWTALITYQMAAPGLVFVWWGTTGNSGAGGNQQTSIVNGAPRAVVANPLDPSQAAALEEYGRNGAWQDLDIIANISNAPAGSKYDAERASANPIPDGAGTSGDYSFYATWQSSDYKIDIPDGAVFDIVSDGWSAGTGKKEKNFKVAWKVADNKKTPFYVHPAGFQMSALKSEKNTAIESWTKISAKQLLSTIPDTSPISIYRLENGEIHFAGKDATGTAFHRSTDDGRTWQLMGRPFDSAYKTQDCQPIFGPLDLAIATKDGQLHVKNSDDGGKTWAAPAGFEPVDLPSGAKALSLRQRTVHGEATLVVTDGTTIQLESKDDGKTWSVIS